MNFEIFLLFVGDIFLPAFNDLVSVFLAFAIVAVVLAAFVKVILSISSKQSIGG